MSDGKVILETGLDNSGVERGLTKMGSLVKNGVGAAAKLSSAAIAGVAAAIGAVGTAATTVGKQFETALAKTSTMFGDVKVDTQGLESQVLALSNATGVAADQIGGSLYNALSAGIPVTEDMGKSMDYMTKNAKLAKAGFTDVDTAVIATAKVLNAYKMDVSETDKVHKVLMQTQNKGITTVGELGSVLAQVTPTASAMNVSFEQIGASLASMTAQGTPTAQATTMLNTLFAELGKQGTNAQKALEKATQGTKFASKSFQDLMKEGVPLNQVLDLMDKSAQSSGISLLDMFGSIEAGKAALALAGQNSEQFTSNLQAMSTETDVVGDAYEKVMDTFEEKSKVAVENLKNLGVSIYNDMKEPLKSAAETGIEYIGRLSDAFANDGLQGLVAEAGDVFADIAVKAAEQAPQMVDTAVSFIRSFAGGLVDNGPKLAAAGTQLVKALADGFVRLLPSEIQKPVQETIDTLTKSLTGGGLNEGIKTIGTVLSNTGKVISKTASVVLPPLSNAVDFLSGNLDVAVPLIATVAAGMKAWSIFNTVQARVARATAAIAACSAAESAQALATAASTGAITLKQIAVGVLTGKIGLVTAAQWLWNTAMNANPVGLIVTAVGALAVGLAALCLTQEQEISSAEKLKQTNEDLSNSYVGIGEQAAAFKQKIQESQSAMKDFNDNMIMSDEEKGQLTKRMDEIQVEISGIAKKASDERRDLMQSEIDKLNELFEEMASIAQKWQEFYDARQTAVQDRAKALAQTYKGDALGFAEASAGVIKSAQEECEKVKEYADAQLTNRIALNNQLYANDQARLEQENAAAQEEYQQAIDSANRKASDTISVLQYEYTQRSDEIQKYLKKNQEYNQQEFDEYNRYEAEKAKARVSFENDRTSGRVSEATAIENYKNLIEKLEEEHNKNLNDIQSDRLEILDDSTQRQLGNLLTLAVGIREKGGKVSQDTADVVTNITDSYRLMDEDTKKEFDDFLLNLGLKFDEYGNLVFTEGQNAGRKLIDGVNTVDTLNPSMQKGGDVPKGFVSGLTANLPDAKQTVNDMIDKDFVGPLQLTDFDGIGSTAGRTLVSGVDTGIRQKVGTVRRASGEVTSAIDATLQRADLSTMGSGYGGQTSRGIASGMTAEQQAVNTAANTITSGLSSAFSSTSLPSKTWGSDLVSGLASGIRGAASLVTSAVGNVARIISDWLHFSRPEKGPLHTYEQWMPDFMLGLARGISSSKGLVVEEVSALAGELRDNMADMDSRISLGIDASGIPADVLRQIRALGEQGAAELTARARAAVQLEMGKISAVAQTYMTQRINSYVDTRSITAAIREGLQGAKVEADGRQIGEIVFRDWDRMVRTHGGR